MDHYRTLLTVKLDSLVTGVIFLHYCLSRPLTLALIRLAGDAPEWSAAAMEKKPRKNAYTPQRTEEGKTEDDEKTRDGTTQKKKAFSMVRSMRKLMKNKKKSAKSNSSSTTTSGSSTGSGSAESRHQLVSEHTRARTNKRSGEKVDEKDLPAAPALVAHTGPTPTTPQKPIPQAGATMMVFTVFENDPMQKAGGRESGEKLAICSPERENKLQWRSAEAERAAAREAEGAVKIPADGGATAAAAATRTPVKKKHKQRNTSLELPGESQLPESPFKVKTPIKGTPGARPAKTPKGRTPARTPVSPF